MRTWTLAPVEVVLIAVVALLAGSLVEKHFGHHPCARQMPFIPSANRWQIFVAPPGEAEFSPQITLGRTFKEAVANMDLPLRHSWTGQHWRVVDCRPPVDFGERWCSAVYR